MKVQYVASQNYLTEVGEFSQSQSYYKIFDQNGNLGEWDNADGSINISSGTRGLCPQQAAQFYLSRYISGIERLWL
jgi:hypothetical protein